MNLLSNAIRYAGNAEYVDVRIRIVADWVEVEVEDYGPGIASPHLNNIFTRFYQVATTERVSRGGLGLGLFISKEIVEAHGGTIQVESQVGQGTKFTVRLPLLGKITQEQITADPS